MYRRINGVKLTMMVLCAAMLSLSCDTGGGGGETEVDNDPTEGMITSLVVPPISCEKSSILSINLQIYVNGTLPQSHNCSIELFYYDQFGGTVGGYFTCKKEEFTTSGPLTISFDNLYPDYYAVVASLATSPNCGQYPYFVSDTLVTGVGITVNCDTHYVDVEYDAQISWGVKGAALTFYMDSVFAPANSRFSLQDDQTALPDSVPADTTDLENYVNQIWTTGYPMQLVAIEDYGQNGSTDSTRTLGWTIPPAPPGNLGDPGGVTIIFHSQFYSWFSSPPYNWSAAEIAETVRRTVVHELGHQRAALTHPSDPSEATTPTHVPGFHCIMDGLHITNYQLDTTYREFCDSCLARLKAVAW